MNEKNISPLQDAVKKCRFVLLAVAVVSLFVNVLMLTVPLYMLQIYGRVLVSRSVETLIYLSVVAIGALLVVAALDFTRSRILAHMSAWLENRLGPEVLPPAISQQLQSQSYGVQALRDVSQVRQFVASPTIFALFDAPWIPVYLFVIYLLHPVLFVIAVIGAVLLFSLAVTNELATRKPLKAANAQNVAALRKTAAAARNAEVIEAMGMMPGITRRWLSDNQEALQQQMLASDRAGVILAATKFFRLVLQVAMLGVGGYLVLQYELTPGGMIAGSIILSRALQPIEQAIGTWKSLLSARSAYARLKTFLIETRQRPVDMSLPAPYGHLSVEKVIFTPPGGQKPVLKGVSFALAAGESLAVVGPSAAGKSTLARLIVGAWRPGHGAVRLDGADVYSWDRVDFGRHVGYLPQDVELFDGTIEDNIARLGEPDPIAVVEAAKRAGVHEMILQLPDGYRTQIGDAGAMLSGGQRQRIGLARAFFGGPRLIVLDEPNASLDSEGENDLLRAMATLKEDGATVVLIAHRPSMVSQVDKILFLRDGMVEMVGPREDVLPQLTRPAAVVQARTG
ncbi:Type I secretion system ATPase [Olavius algarvensis associated proteobacterium Delta 3]|nr:Type I secretion system ATPase [Olavius algarvensis associated proteobacterium Delta 3]